MTDEGCQLVHQDDTKMDEQALHYLEAKEFISLIPAGDNKFLVRLENDGLTYFEDKFDRVKWFLLDNAIAFFALIVAIISLIRTF